MIRFNRIVDLTHTLYPGKEPRKLEIKRHFVDDEDLHLNVPGLRRADKKEWYIMHDINTMSHIGTHLEGPYHYIKDGIDIAEISFDHLVGEACILNFTYKKPGEQISLDEMEEVGVNLRKGDIAILYTGSDKYWHTEEFFDYIVPSRKALNWMIDKPIRLLATDGPGLDPPGIRVKHEENCHYYLFEKGIPLVECVTNLDQLTRERVFVVCLPLKISGLDSSPVRIIAFE